MSPAALAVMAWLEQRALWYEGGRWITGAARQWRGAVSPEPETSTIREALRELCALHLLRAIHRPWPGEAPDVWSYEITSELPG